MYVVGARARVCMLVRLRGLWQVHELTMTHGLKVDIGEALASRNVRKFDAALMLPLYGYKVRACVHACIHVCLPSSVCVLFLCVCGGGVST